MTANPPSKRRPGKRHEYSNIAVVLGTVVVEEASGLPYGEQLMVLGMQSLTNPMKAL